MSKYKKFYLLVIAMLLTASLLVACGGEAPTATTVAQPAATTAASNITTVASSPTTTSAATTTAVSTTAAVATTTTAPAATTVARPTTAPTVAPTSPASSGVSFKEFTSKEGRFTIQLPGTPQEDKQDLGDGAFLYSYTVEVGKNLAYIASYSDYSDSVMSGKKPADILQNVQNGSVNRLATNKLISEKVIALGSIPGREYEYTNDTGVTYHTQAFLAGKRLYQLILGYTAAAKPASADQTKFYGSFKLTDQPAAATAPTAASSNARLSAPVKLDGYIFTIHKLEKPASVNSAGLDLKPKAGNRYLTLDVTIASEQAEDVDANTLYAALVDGAGNQYIPELLGREPDFPTQNNIPAGQQLRGWLTFEVPATATNLTFVYTPISLKGTVIKMPLGE